MCLSQVKSGCQVKIPWLGAPYRAAGAGDSSGTAFARAWRFSRGFEISEEAERITDSLRRDMELSHRPRGNDCDTGCRVLEIPVDPHPGSRGGWDGRSCVGKQRLLENTYEAIWWTESVWEERERRVSSSRCTMSAMLSCGHMQELID